MPKLKFAQGNSKLSKDIWSFSLPAGFTCPGALNCLSRAIEQKDGALRVVDGPETTFRCFAASQEALFRATYNARWSNFKALRAAQTLDAMAALLNDDLPSKATKIRVHVSGDFFSSDYFRAWMRVATLNPAKIFYAYTKALPFWIANKSEVPKNFRLTASRGGKFDALISSKRLKNVRVVFKPSEARKLGLPIDHDDSHAIAPRGNFALLIHGVQPAGSKAAIARNSNKWRGYGPRGKKLASV